MNATNDFDRIVTSWLETDGRLAMDPDAVDVALASARNARQRHGLRAALAGTAAWPTNRPDLPFPPVRSGLLLAASLVVVLAAAVVMAGGTAVPAPSPTPSPARSSSAPAADARAVLPGESWIAYQDVGRGIVLIRPDGTGDHMAFPYIPGGIQEHPDWSPSGDRLVFSVQTAAIWVGDADGSNAEKLVDCIAPCAWVDEPAWSPDGGSIAFQRTVSKAGVGVSTVEIYDIATGGIHIAYEAPPKRFLYAPRWSPDGRSLVMEVAMRPTAALVDSTPTGVALAILDLTKAMPTPIEITDPADLSNNPDWSPLGDAIVFSMPATAAGLDGPADLYTVKPDGSAVTAITHVAALGDQAIKPTFTADGTRIIFNYPDGTFWTIRSDGTDQRLAVAGSSAPGFHARVRPTP